MITVWIIGLFKISALTVRIIYCRMRTQGKKERLESKDLLGGKRHALSSYHDLRFTNQNSIQEEIKSRLKSGNV